MKRIALAIFICIVAVVIGTKLYVHNYNECRDFGHTKLYCLTGAK